MWPVLSSVRRQTNRVCVACGVRVNSDRQRRVARPYKLSLPESRKSVTGRIRVFVISIASQSTPRSPSLCRKLCKSSSTKSSEFAKQIPDSYTRLRGQRTSTTNFSRRQNGVTVLLPIDNLYYTHTTTAAGLAGRVRVTRVLTQFPVLYSAD